jgi:hypothetical protein
MLGPVLEMNAVKQGEAGDAGWPVQLVGAVVAHTGAEGIAVTWLLSPGCSSGCTLS